MAMTRKYVLNQAVILKGASGLVTLPKDTVLIQGGQSGIIRANVAIFSLDDKDSSPDNLVIPEGIFNKFKAAGLLDDEKK